MFSTKVNCCIPLEVVEDLFVLADNTLTVIPGQCGEEPLEVNHFTRQPRVKLNIYFVYNTKVCRYHCEESYSTPRIHFTVTLSLSHMCTHARVHAHTHTNQF